jgi:uncharacterized membrane protein YphA (DoxX/SURF4 family)
MTGIPHFTKLSMMSQYAASKGVPLAPAAVVLTGILLLIAGITIILGFYPEIGVIALVIFYLPVTFMMHNFWSVENPMARMAEQTNFMKNMALMGSALMYLFIRKPWPLSLMKE